jgi:hypothetical protein
MLNSHRQIWLLAAFAMIVSACNTSRTEPAVKHAPSDPSTIQIYQTRPEGTLERLGIVETTENVRWQEDRTDVTPMVESLKAKAAALGANGLILEVPDDPSEKRVQAQGTYQGKSYIFSGTMVPVKKAKAVAIYLHAS